MLDNQNLLKERDSEDTLGSTLTQYQQLTMPVDLQFAREIDRKITSVLSLKTWLDGELTVPLEVDRDYTLPNYVDENTLVIASSCSGNTEEVLEAIKSIEGRDIPRAAIFSGGLLEEYANEQEITNFKLPSDLKIQPRMMTFIQLKAVTAILKQFGVMADDKHAEIADAAEWLREETMKWAADVPLSENYAKQIAEKAAGKTAIFLGGGATWSVAYKWKISWNENAKNVAFWDQYPEFDHNEFIGWTSHPIDKPFALFDIISSFEHPRTLSRFEISNRLLSGKRPQPDTIELKGDSHLKQLLWGNVLADFASIYVGILNNVDPGPVPLISKLKEALASVE
jgi:glucose/mannose-6-phosphate isomerase